MSPTNIIDARSFRISGHKTQRSVLNSDFSRCFSPNWRASKECLFYFSFVKLRIRCVVIGKRRWIWSRCYTDDVRHVSKAIHSSFVSDLNYCDKKEIQKCCFIQGGSFLPAVYNLLLHSKQILKYLKRIFKFKQFRLKN